MKPRSLALVLVSSLALATAACGGDDVASSDSTTTSTTAEETTTTTEAATTTTTEAEATTTTVDIEDTGDTADLEAAVQTLLLTADDLDFDTFSDVGFDPGNPGEGPCGPTGSTIDALVDVGVGLDNANDSLALQEEISVYETDADAAEDFQTSLDALTCTTTPDGAATLGEIQDVTAAVGGDQAVAIPISGTGFTGTVVGVLLSDAIVVFQFIAAPAEAATAPGVPSPIDVAAFGMQKIQDAIGD
jgi:hypothetical protein